MVWQKVALNMYFSNLLPLCNRGEEYEIFNYNGICSHSVNILFTSGRLWQPWRQNSYDMWVGARMECRIGHVHGYKCMSENPSNTKGLGWAFMSCIFFILGMPILMLLAIEGSTWYETFSLMNPMFWITQIFKVTRRVNMADCNCGRSPTGKCVGWHGLSEQQYQEKKSTYEDKQRLKAAAD